MVQGGSLLGKESGAQPSLLLQEMRPHEEKKKKIWDSWQILLRKQSFGDEFN
jgi:hypothetical protein